MTDDPWNEATLRSRIAEPGRRRWPGGSPDGDDIAAYARALDDLPCGTAVVLGMTPELRELALRRFDRVLSVDRSPIAAELYADWIDPDLRRRERLMLASWYELDHLVDEPVAAILGDGVFGNVADEAGAAELLSVLKRSLAPGGTFVTRHACYNEAFLDARRSWRQLLAERAAGRIDDAELGFALRMEAFLDRCWTASTGHLECNEIFRELDRLHDNGDLPQAAWDHAQRYRFEGRNWIPARERWNALLTDGGWRHRSVTPGPRRWCAFYPVYVCTPVSRTTSFISYRS